MKLELAARWAAVGQEPTDADLALLSVEDLRRTERVRSAPVRTRAIVARATLRRLLADLLGGDPRRFTIATTLLGQPVLQGATGVGISLSHSRDRVLVAAGRTPWLGVDLERRDREVLVPPERWCSDEERGLLERLPDAAARRLRTELWTAKEALAKATGIGLVRPLNELVPLDGERCPGGHAAGHEAATLGAWSVALHWLPVGPEHVGALAAWHDPTDAPAAVRAWEAT